MESKYDIQLCHTKIALALGNGEVKYCCITTRHLVMIYSYTLVYVECKIIKKS